MSTEKTALENIQDTITLNTNRQQSILAEISQHSLEGNMEEVITLSTELSKVSTALADAQVDLAKEQVSGYADAILATAQSVLQPLMEAGVTKVNIDLVRLSEGNPALHMVGLAANRKSTGTRKSSGGGAGRYFVRSPETGAEVTAKDFCQTYANEEEAAAMGKSKSHWSKWAPKIADRINSENGAVVFEVFQKETKKEADAA